MKSYTAISLFAGVGGIDLGFEQTGKVTTVWANEFDKNASITFKANHNIKLHIDDIHNVDKTTLPKVDIVLSGFPCQAFSIAGYRKGFDDERGNLFFETLDVIKATNPDVVFLENVKNLLTHDNGNTFTVIREALEQNGYHVKTYVLNAKNYGNVPQTRERIYIIGFKNENARNSFQPPIEIKLTTKLSDVIDFDTKVENKYYYTAEKQRFYDQLEDVITSQDTIYQWRRQYVRENKSGVCPTLTANMGTGGHNVPLIKAKHGIRKLTPRECFNLQGFPNNFILPDIANGQLYKQAGNSVVVPVIKRIAEQIILALEETREII